MFIFKIIKEWFVARERVYETFWKNRGYRWAAAELISSNGNITRINMYYKRSKTAFDRGVDLAISDYLRASGLHKERNYNPNCEQVLFHDCCGLKWIDVDSK